MADIFISYAQADREWVKMLAGALMAENLSVWWDMKVLPGDEFGDIVVREIAASSCVVAVWSANSIGSDWVYGEADEARRAKKLIPVLKDQVQPPTAFRRIHTADFADWNGRRTDSEFTRLIEGIRLRLKGAAPATAVAEPQLQAGQSDSRTASPLAEKAYTPKTEKPIRQTVAGVPSRALLALRIAASAALFVFAIAAVLEWRHYGSSAASFAIGRALEFATIATVSVLAFTSRNSRALARTAFAISAISSLLYVLLWFPVFRDDLYSILVSFTKAGWLVNVLIFGPLAIVFSEQMARKVRIVAVAMVGYFAIFRLMTLAASPFPQFVFQLSEIWAYIILPLAESALIAAAAWIAPYYAVTDTRRALPAK